MTMDIKQEYIQYPQSIKADATNNNNSAPAGKDEAQSLETIFDFDANSNNGYSTENKQGNETNIDDVILKTNANTSSSNQEKPAQIDIITAAAAGKDVAALVEQKNQVDESIETNKVAQEQAQEASAQAQIESDEYGAAINTLTQENESIRANVTVLKSDISQLEETNSTLQSEQVDLESENSGLMGALNEITNAIADAASNAFDAITGIFTGGEEQAALEAQKSSIESQISQNEQEISNKQAEQAANETEISEKETEQNNLENQEEINDQDIVTAQAAQEEADNTVVEEDEKAAEASEEIENGEKVSEQLTEQIEAAEAETNHEPEQTTLPPVIEQTEQPSVIEQVKNTPQTTVAQQPLKNTPVTDSLITGTPELVAQPQEENHNLIENYEYSEAIMTYHDLGIDIDYDTFTNASIIELDTIVETATTQEIMKSTGKGKVVGNISNFTSKKDIEDYSQATSDFIGNYNTLSSYYNTNDVDDFEVKSFLSLSDDMVSNVNQGYVYDTSELQQMSADAVSLLSTLKTKVTSQQSTESNAETQFIQEKTKVESELNDTQTKLGDNAQENKHLDDCKIEFLNLTTSFNSADSDSEQMSHIKLMQKLGEKIERIQNNPDSQNPYLDDTLRLTA